MVRLLCLLLGAWATTAIAGRALGDGIEPRLLHVRSGGVREWSEFPEAAEAVSFEASFAAKKNPAEWTLVLRQQDVKQRWAVSLNGRQIGELTRDENDMVVVFALAAGTLIDGQNVLRPDEPRPSWPRETVLEQAPDTADGAFRVPSPQADS